jgi:hypothetical protein
VRPGVCSRTSVMKEAFTLSSRPSTLDPSPRSAHRCLCDSVNDTILRSGLHCWACSNAEEARKHSRASERHDRSCQAADDRHHPRLVSSSRAR